MFTVYGCQMQHSYTQLYHGVTSPPRPDLTDSPSVSNDVLAPLESRQSLHRPLVA